MTITNEDILTYISTNRLFGEDYDNLTQDMADTMGRDAVASARSWLWGRFYKADRVEIFTSWKESVYDGLDDTDLTNLDSIRTALAVIDEDNVERNVMLFDVLVQLAITNIWQDAAMEEVGERIKLEAQEMLDAIVGQDAFPTSPDGGGSSGERTNPGEAFVIVDEYSSDDITDYTGGYE